MEVRHGRLRPRRLPAGCAGPHLGDADPLAQGVQRRPSSTSPSRCWSPSPSSASRSTCCATSLPDGAFLRGSERTIATAMWVGVALHLIGILPGGLGGPRFHRLHRRQAAHLAAPRAAGAGLGRDHARHLACGSRKLIEGRDPRRRARRALHARGHREARPRARLLPRDPRGAADRRASTSPRSRSSAARWAWASAFGLQKIASNYVSGFIILLDRSVRIGDLVTVDNRHGVVKEIASRYTVIRSLDGTESILPNETLITQAVTNHSFTDRKVLVEGEGGGRLRLRHRPRLRADPGGRAQPAARAGRAGARAPGSRRSATTASRSSWASWIADPDQGQAALRGAILKDVLEAFRAEGIEIPFPQRDVTARFGRRPPPEKLGRFQRVMRFPAARRPRRRKALRIEFAASPSVRTRHRAGVTD